MAIKFNDSIDLSFNELLNSLLQSLGSDPGTGVTPGRIYYSTVEKAIRLRTDTGWITVGAADVETTQDIVGGMVAGNAETGITVTYDDTTGKLDFSVQVADATDFAEAVSDQIGTMVIGNTENGITVTYQDSDNTLDFTVTDSPTVAGNTPAQLRDRSTHTGTQSAATVSDFDSQVRTNRLDQLASPAANISFGNFRLTNLAIATADADAVSFGQARDLVRGLDQKASVRVASTGAVDIAAAPSAIDGVTLASGDRVLLKHQSTGSQNGIYVFNGASAAMTRAPDADVSSEVTSGLYVFVDQGVTQANKGYQLFTDDPITLGTTSLDFQPVSGAGQITAGAGLTKTGDTIDVNPGPGVVITSDQVTVDRTTNGTKVGFVYAADLAGGAMSEVITHNLGTRDVRPVVYLKSGTYAEEGFTVEHTTVNTITVRSSVVIPTSTYRCVISG